MRRVDMSTSQRMRPCATNAIKVIIIIIIIININILKGKSNDSMQGKKYCNYIQTSFVTIHQKASR
jgi:hypothetical protein